MNAEKISHAKPTVHSPAVVRPKCVAASPKDSIPPAYEALGNKFSHAKLSYIARQILPVSEIRPQAIKALQNHRFVSYSTEEIDSVLEPLKNTVRIGQSDLYAFATESQIKECAAEYSRSVQAFVSQNPPRTSDCIPDFLSALSSAIQFTGITFPLEALTVGDRETEEGYKRRVISALARLHCDRWWRRQLRKQCHRTAENYMRKTGRVGRGISPYISTYTNSRIRSREDISKEFLKNSMVESDAGDLLTLESVAASSLANPRNRLSEAYARAVGCDHIREEFKLSAVFVTITAPSRFHSRIVKGEGSIPNPKFDGSTPRECQEYLSKVWARIRASLARHCIDAFGMRVAEGHHDGSIHWHLMIYVEPKSLDSLIDICDRYATQEDAGELTTEKKQKARFHAEIIDTSRAAPRTYLFKYLTKNLQGSQEISDETGGPISETVDSVRRLCSTYGIRQFQFFGQPSVTVWRQLRRLKDKNLGELSAEHFSEIREAACAGNWAEFVRLMGGACTPRKDQPIKPLREYRGENDYGDFVYEIRGLVMAQCLEEIESGAFSRTVITSDKTWRVLTPYEVSSRFGFRGRAAAPLDNYQ